MDNSTNIHLDIQIDDAHVIWRIAVTVCPHIDLCVGVLDELVPLSVIMNAWTPKPWGLL